MDAALEHINWLSIPVGAVIYMIIGGLWYSPMVAGKAWMDVMGTNEEKLKAEGANPGAAMGKSFVAALFMSFGMAVLIAMPGVVGNLGWLDGLHLGLFVSVLVVGGATFPNYAFENRSLKHFLIHMGNQVISMTAIGAMMGAWA